jgi:mitochondrial fission protein ELM1
LLLIASRDQLNGTLEGMVGWADVVVVTGESISMVSEACASGKRVIVVDPPARPSSGGSSKVRRYVHRLVAGGYARVASVSALGQAIRQALDDQRPVRRLDTYATIESAVTRLL